MFADTDLNESDFDQVLLFQFDLLVQKEKVFFETSRVELFGIRVKGGVRMKEKAG